jgi:amino acid transporter
MQSELDKILDNTEPPKVQNTQGENKIANTIHGIGLGILILGILAGLIIGASLTDPASTYRYSPDPHPLRWIYGGTLILSSLISGVLFIGFGEAIKILHDIRNHTRKE